MLVLLMRMILMMKLLMMMMLVVVMMRMMTMTVCVLLTATNSGNAQSGLPPMPWPSTRQCDWLGRKAGRSR